MEKHIESRLKALNETYAFQYSDLYGKALVVRKDQKCFTGRPIPKGSPAYRMNILPSTSTGRLWDLQKPKTIYFYGRCGDCTVN